MRQRLRERHAAELRRQLRQPVEIPAPSCVTVARKVGVACGQPVLVWHSSVATRAGVEGMLGAAQESGTYWFNPGSLEAETEFMLLGLVASLAIYNGADEPLMVSRIIVVFTFRNDAVKVPLQQLLLRVPSIALCVRESRIPV